MDIEIIWNLLITLGLTALAVVIIKLCLNYIKKIVYHKTQNSPTPWDDIFYDLLDSTKITVITIWVLNSMAYSLNLHERILNTLKIVMIFAGTYQVITWAIKSIRGWRDRKLKEMVVKEESARTPIGLITSVMEVLVILIVMMMGLSNLGIDIGALIAGLGIGGIAVALAAQNILGDLFASFSILFDKPFVIGDFILVGQDMGTVENIGLKTTRVKSLTGEQLIFSNKDLLESRIRNFKRMRERRVVQKFRFHFQTSVEHLQHLPQWIQEILTKKEKVRFDYCCLTEIGEYAYVYEVVFWMLDPDNTLYLKTQESFYHDLIVKINQEEVFLAVPTHAVILGSDKNEDTIKYPERKIEPSVS